MAIPQAPASPLCETLIFSPGNNSFWMTTTGIRNAFYLPCRKVCFVLSPREGKKWIVETGIAEQFNPEKIMYFETGTKPEIKLATIPSAFAERIQKVALDRIKCTEMGEKTCSFDTLLAKMTELPKDFPQDDEKQFTKFLEQKLGKETVDKMEEISKLEEAIRAEEFTIAQEFNALVDKGQINLA